MAHEAVCRNGKMAVEIIETIAEGMKEGTQKDALKATAFWVKEHISDIPESYEERDALELSIETELRNCLTDEQRRAKAAFYLEGIGA